MEGDLYDISRYTISDLLEIFGLSNSPSVADVQSAVDTGLERALEARNNSLSTFIREGGDKLISFIRGVDAEGSTGIAPGASAWLASQALGNEASSQSSNYVAQSGVQIATHSGQPVTSRSRIPANQPMNVPIVQGTVNSNISNNVTRTVTIDSSKRRHLFPYNDNNPNFYTSSTNFYMNLNIPLTGVLGYTLGSLTIPYTFYPVDYCKGNNYLWVVLEFDASGNPVLESAIPVSIPPGAYTSDQLSAAVQTAINAAVSPWSVDLSFNEQTRKYSASTDSPNKGRLYFYDLFGRLPVPDASFCVPAPKLDTCLGYMVGFRPGQQESKIEDHQLTASHPSFYIELVNTDDPVVGDATANLNAAPYITMLLDDGNYNYANNSNITIIDTIPYAVPPMKVPADASYVCIDDVRVFVPGNPRKLTNSQIFALNVREQKEHQQVIHTRALGCDLPNSFAKLTYDTAGISFGGNLSIIEGTSAQRQFYGPVTINRFNIRLVDNNGYTLNLHGQDWSFQLSVNQLYEY